MAPVKAKKVTLTLKKPCKPKHAPRRTRHTTSRESGANGNNFVLDPRLQDETLETPSEVVNEAPPEITDVNLGGQGQNIRRTVDLEEEMAAMRGGCP